MRRLRRVLAGFCAALGLLVLLVTFTPLTSWYGRALAGRWDDPEGDMLIVLGDGDFSDGIPAEGSIFRTVSALRAYQTGHFRKVVPVGYKVGAEMGELLACRGVPREKLMTEDASRSTRENALYTARLLAAESGSKVLLTSDFHMFRAQRAFRKAGLATLPRPVPDALKRSTRFWRRWPAFQDEAVETVKIVYYYLRGWI
ncbi:MAG: YdcF family protein [Acidobacteriia bacterium]|nr:YdcF family protein [Terriglobia bacterium]